jgi:hypothetical protein
VLILRAGAGARAGAGFPVVFLLQFSPKSELRCTISFLRHGYKENLDYSREQRSSFERVMFSEPGNCPTVPIASFAR